MFLIEIYEKGTDHAFEYLSNILNPYAIYRPDQNWIRYCFAFGIY